MNSLRDTTEHHPRCLCRGCCAERRVEEATQRAEQAEAEAARWKRLAEAQQKTMKELAIAGGEGQATIARVGELAVDMRTWCSPYGFSVRCADAIDEALAEPARQGLDQPNPRST